MSEPPIQIAEVERSAPAFKRWTALLWLCAFAGAGWILVDRLRAVDLVEVLHQLQTTPTAALLAGLACASGVYLLVGLYEGVAVRIASGRKMLGYACRTALIANPIGRAIGVAVVSGGALRYRLYSAAGLSAREVAAVIALAAMPYLLAVGWLIDLSLLFHLEEASATLRLSVAVVFTLAIIGLIKDIGWPIFVARRKQPLVIRGQAIALPTLRDTLVQTAFGLMQLSLMTATLYVFMPPELGMSWPQFIAVYCLAFIAGQLSNVPAGLGVLEAALLLLLPHVPPAKLLGAVLAYRAVFELLPLLNGLLLLTIFEATHPTGLVRRRRG